MSKSLPPMGGSEGTVGDGGGTVTPTAVPEQEADEEKDTGPEACSENDKDFDEE